MKKFIALLSILILLSSLLIGSNDISFGQQKYNEAPELTELVKQGKLPPIEQRLPKEPLVITPLEEIGKYGGVCITGRPADLPTAITDRLLYEFMITYSTPNLDKILPNVAKAWKVTGGGKIFTFFLREGMKWSDGHPFTADDILFWYEDIIKNDELTPSKPAALMAGGKLGKVRKLSPYVVEFSFESPNGVFIEEMCRWRPEPYAPAHYLKQFHTKYTSIEKIQTEMKKEGFNRWSEFFSVKRRNITNPECPTLSAWVATNKPQDQIQIFKRNPYYWKVDTNGNQLPYIGRIEVPMFTDSQAMLLKALAGELTYIQGAWLGGIESYPTLVQNQERGNYRIVPYLWPPNNFGAIYFNFTHKDPVLRKLFNDKRFRIALSVALNREEISNMLFKGQAVPSQPSPPPGPPYYGDSSLFKKYIQYDPKYANQLLDEIGLTKRDKDGFRMRPDGKELIIVNLVNYPSEPPQIMEMAELYRKYWEKVGLRVVNKPVSREVFTPQIQAGEYDLATAGKTPGGRPINIFTRGDLLPSYQFWLTAPKWSLWLNTGGKEGEEPPSEVKRLREIYLQGISESAEKKRNALIMEAFKINIDNLLAIGVVNEPDIGKYYVVSNRLRNVHRPNEPMPVELYPIPPAQWFIK